MATFMEGDVQALSLAEVEALGLSNIVHNGNMSDEDNPIADYAATSGLPQTDSQGRLIISYAQYKRFSELGAPLHNYAMRMYWPTNPSKTNTIQASKFLKWYGAGYRPVGELIENRKKALNIAQHARTVVDPTDDETVIYWCRDKYPECKRFFDSAKGLNFHWQREHGDLTKSGKPFGGG